MDWLETKYILLVGGRCRNFKRVSDKVYNFSCPICGDSKRHPRKARGYITCNKDDKVVYTCHKCGAHMPFFRFLQEQDAGLYADYQTERLTAGLWAPKRRTEYVAADPSTTAPERLTAAPETISDLPDYLKPLTRVDRLKKTHYARLVCEKRLLPDLTRVYHCPKFYLWVNHVIPGKFSEKALFFDHPRLIIPFLDETGRMIAFQGRAYDPNAENKYITIKVDENAPKIFGLEILNRDKIVYALEGPIDSMFIPNAIAFAGGDHTVLEGFDKDKTVVIYDNEPRSKFTPKKVENAIRDGYKVCIWPSHVKEKDVNDMIMNGLDVKRIIDERTFQGMLAELELKIWKKN